MNNLEQYLISGGLAIIFIGLVLLFVEIWTKYPKIIKNTFLSIACLAGFMVLVEIIRFNIFLK